MRNFEMMCYYDARFFTPKIPAQLSAKGGESGQSALPDDGFAEFDNLSI
jgi:hypothetical protein